MHRCPLWEGFVMPISENGLPLGRLCHATKLTCLCVYLCIWKIYLNALFWKESFESKMWILSPQSKSWQFRNVNFAWKIHSIGCDCKSSIAYKLNFNDFPHDVGVFDSCTNQCSRIVVRLIHLFPLDASCWVRHVEILFICSRLNVVHIQKNLFSSWIATFSFRLKGYTSLIPLFLY